MVWRVLGGEDWPARLDLDGAELRTFDAVRPKLEGES
jgi:hypothetical protein